MRWSEHRSHESLKASGPPAPTRNLKITRRTREERRAKRLYHSSAEVPPTLERRLVAARHKKPKISKPSMIPKAIWGTPWKSRATVAGNSRIAKNMVAVCMTKATVNDSQKLPRPQAGRRAIQRQANSTAVYAATFCQILGRSAAFAPAVVATSMTKTAIHSQKVRLLRPATRI